MKVIDATNRYIQKPPKIFMAADIGFDFEKVVQDVVSRKYEDMVSIDKSFRKENP